MARIDFINELKALGFTIQEPDAVKIQFEYEIPVGRNIGKKIQIGFDVPNEYPMNCPPGPNFQSTAIAGWMEPTANIHASGFGTGWRYWSRPFPDWNRSDKKARTYLAHIKNILAKV
jgi:hypothetical protein